MLLLLSMLALCLMLSVTYLGYYAQKYAGIIGWSLRAITLSSLQRD